MRPLTPSKAATIIRNIFSDKQDVKREQINISVKNYYEEEVGTENVMYGQAFDVIITKALGSLKKCGEATNEGGYGYWNFGSISNSELPIEDYIIDQEDGILDPRKIIPGKIIGPEDATKIVYVYFYPAYKELAVLKNEKYWRCKIGRTDSIEPVFRIQSQVTTEICELPIVPFLIRTNNSNGLERSIHTAIENRGRKCDTALGKEWYYTNPEEVEEIVKFIENYK
jgi:hypothetical protein